MEELWAGVVGYEDWYQVSTYGRLRRTDTGRVRKTPIGSHGYPQSLLSLGSRQNQISRKVHRMLAETFIPNPESKPQVNHINSDREDNWVGNLEWVTEEENNIHARDSGRTSVGESSDWSKISEEDVIFIRTHFIPRDSMYSGIMLAKMFDLKPASISCIVHRKCWKHID